MAALLYCSHSFYASPLVKTEATYYDVELKYADTLRVLHQILESSSPRDKNGNKALETSDWNLDWRFNLNFSGQRCRLSAVKVTFVKRYTMPKALSLPRPEKIAFAYHYFLKRLNNYREQRYKIIKMAADKIENRLAGLSWPGDCTHKTKIANDEALSIRKTYLAKLGAFDRDNHYGYKGYYFKRYPWNDGHRSPEIHVDFNYFEFDLESVRSAEAIDQKISNYSTITNRNKKSWGSAFWMVYWKYDLKRGSNDCRLEQIHTSLEVLYTMPKALSYPADPALRKHYEQTYQHVMEHEEMHASTGIAAVKHVEKYLKSYAETGDCKWAAKTVLAGVNTIIERYRARDAEFDKTTAHSGQQDDYHKLFGERPWSTHGGSYNRANRQSHTSGL